MTRLGLFDFIYVYVLLFFFFGGGVSVLREFRVHNFEGVQVFSGFWLPKPVPR